MRSAGHVLGQQLVRVNADRPRRLNVADIRPLETSTNGRKLCRSSSICPSISKQKH